MEAVQLTLFGKMFPEHLAATGVTISGESCKKSQRPQFQCLNLEDGHQAEWLELNKLESLGELSMPSIGAYPSKGSESTLSEILEINVPKKYYLSPKACQGILRRAQKRGKILPSLLKAALEAQADGKLLVTRIDDNQDAQSVGTDVYNGLVSAYAIGNGQRDNTGLHEIPGALNCMHDQQSILAAYPINTQVVTRNNKDDGRTCFGIGENGDPSYTLQAAHSHGVIYSIDRVAFNQGENALYDFQINDNEINSTIVAKGPSAVLDTRLSVWVVRRLTPTECERLQGFPDDWTKYDTYGIQIKDTPRYAALGNSIAIPCALRVFKGILDVEGR